VNLPAHDTRKVIHGWRLFLTPCRGGFSYEWRGDTSQVFDRVICSGWTAESRCMAEVKAERELRETLNGAAEFRERKSVAMYLLERLREAE